MRSECEYRKASWQKSLRNNRLLKSWGNPNFLIQMMRFTSAITALAISNNALTANIAMAFITHIGIFIVYLTSANTTSRHINPLKY